MQAYADRIHFLHASALSGLFGILSNTSDVNAPGIDFKEILARFSGSFQALDSGSQIENSALLAVDQKPFPGHFLGPQELENLIPVVIPMCENLAEPAEEMEVNDYQLLSPPAQANEKIKEGKLSELRFAQGKMAPAAGRFEFIKIDFKRLSGDYDSKSECPMARISEIYKKDTPFAERTIGIDRLIDFLGVPLKAAENGEKGGKTFCQNLVALTDLENLEIGESIELTFASNFEDKPVAIKLTRENSGQICHSKSFTCYAIEISSYDETVKLKSLLVRNGSIVSEQSDLKDLEGLIEKNRGRDAQLIVFVPKGKIVQDQDLWDIRANANLGKVSAAINMARQVDSPPLAQAAIKAMKSCDDSHVLKESQAKINGQTYQPLSDMDFKSATDQAFAERQGDKSQAFDFADGPAKNAIFKSFGERPEGQLIQMTADQNANFIKGEVENKFTEVMKEPDRFPQVEFKLELPREGFKISQGGYFRIRLEPEILGKIDVQLKVINDRLVAYMEVDKPAARQVVEANLPRLKETLQNHGIRVETIMVNLSGDGGLEGNLSNREMVNRWRNRMRFNSRLDLDTVSNQRKSNVAVGGAIANLKGRLSLLA